MANSINLGRHLNRPYMMAVVLGTALSTFASTETAFAASTEATQDAIADINRYCTTCWRNARLPVTSWGDCTQEVFARLLQRLPADAWKQVLQTDGEERREFFRAIDAVKKRTQRARKFTGCLDAVADRNEVASRQRAEERDLVREKAAELLTARQQRILQLSFDGWTVQEMAKEMHLPAERVSDEKYKAIRKLRDHLSERERQTDQEELASLEPSRLPA
jgi:RNA polymerase sigma factor (sigma-70 family)